MKITPRKRRRVQAASENYEVKMFHNHNVLPLEKQVSGAAARMIGEPGHRNQTGKIVNRQSNLQPRRSAQLESEKEFSFNQAGVARFGGGFACLLACGSGLK